MQLILTEDQELIAKTAADFLAEKAPLSRTRKLRDESGGLGYGADLWKEMAELGWVGIPFPESLGGSDLGYAEMVVVLEAAGRTLAPEPFLASLLASEALLRCGDGAQQARWLTPALAGTSTLALAFDEASTRFRRCFVETRAVATAEGFRIDGEKVGVLDGHAADTLIVAARTAGDADAPDGIGLFVVPADAVGVSRQRQTRVDSRGAALVRFEGVVVEADAMLAGASPETIDAVFDRATVALCGEMLGGMQQALDMTLGYLREREQFGVRIGSFQALKHRAARAFIEVELSRSTVMGAARALDEGAENATKLVSLAKAHCSEAYINVTNEAVQMYGGVGMTDEYDIGFFMKRARAAASTFGDAAWHRDRWAGLSGY